MYHFQDFRRELNLEYHWWWILRYRRLLARLHHGGAALSSRRMQAVNARLTKHALAVMDTEQYEPTVPAQMAERSA